MLIRRVLSTSSRYQVAARFSTDAKNLKIGVPKEVFANEKRVAITPEAIERMVKKNGVQFLVESGAGQGASIPDERYVASGAKIVSAQEALEADVVLKVRQPQFNPTLNKDETDVIKEGSTLISFLYPAQNKDLVQKIKNKGITAFAMDQIPRITRAQTYDALSSMANIAGYKAVITAA